MHEKAITKKRERELLPSNVIIEFYVRLIYLYMYRQTFSIFPYKSRGLKENVVFLRNCCKITIAKIDSKYNPVKYCLTAATSNFHINFKDCFEAYHGKEMKKIKIWFMRTSFLCFGIDFVAQF